MIICLYDVICSKNESNELKIEFWGGGGGMLHAMRGRDEKVYHVKTDHRVMTLFVFLPCTQKVRGAMQGLMCKALQPIQTQTDTRQEID